MTAIVRPESRPVGAPRSDRWRWVCRDHGRLRVGYWGTQWRAQTGRDRHNAKEHPRPADLRP